MTRNHVTYKNPDGKYVRRTNGMPWGLELEVGGTVDEMTGFLIEFSDERSVKEFLRKGRYVGEGYGDGVFKPTTSPSLKYFEIDD